MKKILIVLTAALAAALGTLAYSFAPVALETGAAPQFEIPAAKPPAGMRISVLHAGKMFSKAGFAYRGGDLTESRVFGMAAILVQHPKGRLLFDAGFGSRVDEHFRTIPPLMQKLSKYEKEATVAQQLAAAGIAAESLMGIVLTHAHWDHVSGLEDLKGVPVWVTQPELDFIRSGNRGARLAHSFGELNYKTYAFDGGPYLGFEHSLDVFGDGSVVLVPVPGHTPGSIIAFVTLPGGGRYALVGDLVWQREGVEIPAERPWVSSDMVDDDAEGVRRWIVHMHHLSKAMPGLVIVPAHDRRVLETLPSLGAAG
jgi:glyoxylase-like metal-dependent hydrolase (beta-lactamase superfamily II)